MKILVAFILLTILLWVFCNPFFDYLGKIVMKLLKIEGRKVK